MPDADDVWNVISLKELIEQRFNGMDKAVEIAFTEQGRRLDILNHAHERAVEVQHTYVPREVFEAFEARFDEYKETTNRALILREGQSKGLSMSAGVVVAGLAAVGTLLGIVVVLANVLTN